MGKKTISTRLPEELVDKIDQTNPDNRTDFIRKACIKQLHDESLIEKEIEQQKDVRDRMIREKQELERKIEQKRDEIRDLEGLKSEVRSFNQVKEKIPDKVIHKIRQTVRVNKYDNDPRASTPEQVIEYNSKRIVEEYDVDDVETVKEVLRLHTEA